MKKVVLCIAALFTSVSAFAANGNPTGGPNGNSWLQQVIRQRNEFTIMLPATEELNRQYLYLSDWGSNDDSIIFKLFLTALLPEGRIIELVHSQKADGSWPDIDYADTKLTNWQPYNHVTNIYVMARAYKTPTSKVYGSPEVAAAIHKALNFWFRANLKCTNWWQNEIGVGRMLGPVLLLLRDQLTQDELDGGIRVLSNSTFRQTGQNKVWQASNICIKALLLDDEALVRRCRDTIFSELRAPAADGVRGAATDGPAVEGLQPDWSFHQHGPQMQFGNYGMSFAIVQAEWAEIFRDTPVALDKEREELLANYIEKGLQWTIWRGSLDMNASGRQLARNTHRAKVYSLALGVEHLMTVRPDDPALRAFLDRNIFHREWPNDLTGFTFFPRSDYGVMRTPSWFASVRMHSNRTVGFETTAGDNRQGIFSADGTLIVMRTGDEYENIAPVWDWKRLPGVTVADNGKPIPFRATSDHSDPRNKSGFVGGLRCGDDRNAHGDRNVGGGVMAMELIYENRFEHKGYFITDEGIFVLGAGLRVDSALRTTTGIEQNNLRGDVYYSVFAKDHIHSKVSRLGREKEVRVANPRWIYHNNTGYILLQGANVVISNRTQSGNWRDISTNDIDKTISKPVFKAYIDHGVQPYGTYAWFVVPDVEQGPVDKWKWLDALAEWAPTTILENSADLQAVGSGGNIQAIFYKPGTLTLPDRSTITLSEAAILSVDAARSEIRVADPTQKLEKVVVTIAATNGRLENLNGKYTFETGEASPRGTGICIVRLHPCGNLQDQGNK